MKLVNKFFREVKRLKDTERAVTSQRGVWPFGRRHEASPDECFKRPDGLWENYQKINTHQKHGGELVIFLWRLEPNYCCAGRPVYTAERVHQFLANSETEKIIVSRDGYDFVWKWSDVKMPTEIRWGMDMGDCYYELRKGEEVLIQTPVKAEFLRQYNRIKSENATFYR